MVAVWKVNGVDQALRDLDALEGHAALASYYLLPALKGRLLAIKGESAGARRTLEAALRLPCSEPERRLLRRQIERL
ncbi:MAG: hypothetical protein H0W08_26210 [Acidobacteria bacterium]|nr:hypothetical protein [Acidobacteriota bacterium]